MIALWGPQARRILSAVFEPLKSHRQEGADVIALGRLVDKGRVIDEAVVHRRGNFAEINIHGGPAAARAALEALAARGAQVAQRPSCETFQPAHPRLDNPAVGKELLEALMLARSAFVAGALTQQWSGGISELARRALEGDGPTRGVAAALRGAAAGLAVMKRLLEPAEVVIAGPPNVGKSALANALAGRQISIVDETVGTTRDWVRELALVRGVPIWLTDTAGLWAAPSPVDAEAVRRARHRAESADLVLLVQAGAPTPPPQWLHAKRLLRVSAKCDVCPPQGQHDAAVSAMRGDGLDELRNEILRALGLAHVNATAPMAFTEGQAKLLAQAADALDDGQTDLARHSLNALLSG